MLPPFADIPIPTATLFAGSGPAVWLAGAVFARSSGLASSPEHDWTIAKISSTATPSTIALRRQ